MPRAEYLLAALLVVLIGPMAVLAGVPGLGPRSHTKTTPNGKYILVMIAPLSAEEDAGRFVEPYASDIRAIRATYAKSGLYHNDGSKTPLWTVDWHADHVMPLSDGIHLVRTGGPSSSPGSEAVAFFAKGTLLKSYEVSDLVSFSIDVFGLSCGRISRLLDETQQYTIDTDYGEHYVFDVTTGEIVEEFRTPRLIMAVVVLLLLAGGVHLLAQRRRKAVERDAPDDADTPRP